jgi:hypothetical protein
VGTLNLTRRKALQSASLPAATSAKQHLQITSTQQRRLLNFRVCTVHCGLAEHSAADDNHDAAERLPRD